MPNLICPFLREECNYDCVFNNGCFDQGDRENCDLLDAIQTIRSFQAPDNQVDKRQKEILSELQSICSEVGYNHNDSNDVKELLEQIKKLLKNQS